MSAQIISVRSALQKVVPLFAVSILALGACAGPASNAGADEPPLEGDPGLGVEETPGDAIPIEGIDGAWIYLDGRDGTGPLNVDGTDHDITLVISGNSVSGQSACNNYSTTFTGEPAELSLGAIASTRRACEDALMDFDSRFFSALELVTAIIPTGGSLVLQGEGINLDFLPSSALPLG
ncbi:META domain-containing protein [Salinibacterium sp. M195]|uniref:META domain-containing protein n=1 Tax=Salinibacterium sp. M195 TaxID=2583374 RepID=UPI001C638D2F|nr:META domain-containing protein [Salinibacterium sp. M195]QYH35668.1 META domain-containing protein [Salinibacterium sp. M195]